MSYKTYSAYTSDNVVKTIENTDSNVYTTRRNKEVDPMKKTLKDALLVYVTETLGEGAKEIRITYEKMVTDRYFNWSTFVSITEDELINMLKSLKEDSWEVFYG